MRQGIDQDASDARDPLTGLAGPEAARDRLREWQADVGEGGRARPIHSMLLGLRRFDTVNLAYGADAGDAALVEVAGRMLHFAAAEIEGEWMVARIGGGTFLFAAQEECSRERWRWLAETLATTISQPIANLAPAAAMRLWPRIALMRSERQVGPDKLIGALAQTLESLAESPAQRIAWVDGEELPGGRDASELERDLIAALDRDEIAVLFQGQFACADGRLIGAEALARWEHPQLGRLGAQALFAIAARADQTASLSRHIARTALALASEWPDRLRLSLNVTPADLALSSFAEETAMLVRASGIAPERVTLEITEQVLLTDLDRSAALLAKLSAAGMRIALDDFGAGFCNFRYLKLLPLDYLKLDRAMVDGITRDPRDLAVFRGIVAMAQALDLQVIAEGIEQDDQLAIVKGEGVPIYQGFVGSRPLSPEDFATLAER